MQTQATKARQFQALHERGIFVAPNPWDLGSALMLQQMGFAALASTSSGLAMTLGQRDGQLAREQVLSHCAALTAALDIPLTADLENGFGDSPEAVAETIRLAAQAGLSGGSIEDFTGDLAAPLYPLNLAVERVVAAVEEAARQDSPFLVTARAEQMLRSERDLDATIERLVAFEKAGAQVLYAPGLRDYEQVGAVLAAVTRPVNVLIAGVKGADVAGLQALGVRRISTGGALARAALAPLLAAGREMLDTGSFAWLGSVASVAQLDALLPASPDD